MIVPNNTIEIKIGICNQKSNPIRIEPTKVAAAHSCLLSRYIALILSLFNQHIVNIDINVIVFSLSTNFIIQFLFCIRTPL